MSERIPGLLGRTIPRRRTRVYGILFAVALVLAAGSQAFGPHDHSLLNAEPGHCGACQLFAAFAETPPLISAAQAPLPEVRVIKPPACPERPLAPVLANLGQRAPPTS